jgi:S-adenosylmethionine synthetase
MESDTAMTNLQYFTSESVTSGHPDKVCDQISDAILDEMLREDKSARVAVETLASAGLIHVAGEVTTETYVDIAEVVRGVIRRIGYDSAEAGFDADACGIMLSIGAQAPEIGGTVSVSKETREGSTDPLDAQGAGDQGLMFGYACSETPQLIPVSIWLAHRLAERLETVRKNGTLSYLRPDGKTQVTIAYDGDVPVAVDTVVVSTQHAEFVDGAELTQQRIAADVTEHVILPVLALTELDTPVVRSFTVDPAPMPVSPAAKLLLIPMGVLHVTVVAPSRAKIRQKLTAVRRMPCVGWPRTLSPLDWLLAWKFRLRMRLARLVRSVCTLRLLALTLSTLTSSVLR